MLCPLELELDPYLDVFPYEGMEADVGFVEDDEKVIGTVMINGCVKGWLM